MAKAFTQKDVDELTAVFERTFSALEEAVRRLSSYGTDLLPSMVNDARLRYIEKIAKKESPRVVLIEEPELTIDDIASAKSIWDIHVGTVSELAKRLGISDRKAWIARQTVEKLLDRAALLVQFDIATLRSYPSMEPVVLEAYRIKVASECLNKCRGFLRQRSKIEASIREVSERAGTLRWLLATPSERLSALNSYQYLQRLMESGYTRRASLFCDESRSIGTLAAEYAWDDLKTNADYYVNLFNRVSPEAFIAAGGELKVPKLSPLMADIKGLIRWHSSAFEVIADALNRTCEVKLRMKVRRNAYAWAHPRIMHALSSISAGELGRYLTGSELDSVTLPNAQTLATGNIRSIADVYKACIWDLAGIESIDIRTAFALKAKAEAAIVTEVHAILPDFNAAKLSASEEALLQAVTAYVRIGTARNESAFFYDIARSEFDKAVSEIEECGYGELSWLVSENVRLRMRSSYLLLLDSANGGACERALEAERTLEKMATIVTSQVARQTYDTAPHKCLNVLKECVPELFAQSALGEYFELVDRVQAAPKSFTGIETSIGSLVNEMRDAWLKQEAASERVEVANCFLNDDGIAVTSNDTISLLDACGLSDEGLAAALTIDENAVPKVKRAMHDALALARQRKVFVLDGSITDKMGKVLMESRRIRLGNKYLGELQALRGSLSLKDETVQVLRVWSNPLSHAFVGSVHSVNLDNALQATSWLLKSSAAQKARELIAQFDRLQLLNESEVIAETNYAKEEIIEVICKEMPDVFFANNSKNTARAPYAAKAVKKLLEKAEQNICMLEMALSTVSETRLRMAIRKERWSFASAAIEEVLKGIPVDTIAKSAVANALKNIGIDNAFELLSVSISELHRTTTVPLEDLLDAKAACEIQAVEAFPSRPILEKNGNTLPERQRLVFALALYVTSVPLRKRGAELLTEIRAGYAEVAKVLKTRGFGEIAWLVRDGEREQMEEAYALLRNIANEELCRAATEIRWGIRVARERHTIRNSIGHTVEYDELRHVMDYACPEFWAADVVEQHVDILSRAEKGLAQTPVEYNRLLHAADSFIRLRVRQLAQSEPATTMNRFLPPRLSIGAYHAPTVGQILEADEHKLSELFDLKTERDQDTLRIAATRLLNLASTKMRLNITAVHDETAEMLASQLKVIFDTMSYRDACKTIQQKRDIVEQACSKAHIRKGTIAWSVAQDEEKNSSIEACEWLSTLLDGEYGLLAKQIFAGPAPKNLSKGGQAWKYILSHRQDVEDLLKRLTYGLLTVEDLQKDDGHCPIDDKQLKKALGCHLELQSKIDLANHLASEQRLRKRVREAAFELRKLETTRQLLDTPIEEIKARCEGVRVGALRAAGYTSIGAVVLDTKERLAAVKGISELTAWKVKWKCDEIRDALIPSVKIRLSSDDRSAETRQLVKAIYSIITCRDARDKLSRIAEDYKFEVKTAIDVLASTGWGEIAWGIQPESRNIMRYSYDIVRWTSWGIYANRISEASENLIDKATPSEREAWDAFISSPYEFYDVLEEVVPELVGVGGTYGLPEELAKEILEEDFFPDGLLCRLRDYQVYGVKYALHQKRVLLGDEMGLGKTVQAIAAMVSLRNTGERHFLVICPASVLVNWCREVRSKSRLWVHVLHGRSFERAFRSWIFNGGVAVTTFETLAKVLLPEGLSLGMLVVDEAHYVKNPKAIRSKRVYAICDCANRVLFMTGTPLENNVYEMIRLMRVLQPGVADEARSIATIGNAEVFKKAIIPVYYRRKREDVLSQLPELSTAFEWCTLGSKERERYEYVTLGLEKSHKFMAMRRVSWDVPDVRRHSSKAKRLMQIVEEARLDGRKAIVFSFFRRTLDAVAFLFGNRAVGPINGSVSPTRRQKILDDFEHAPAGAVLVAQIQSGGTGLNIQSASVVVICEPQIKPSLEMQAISRAYRMGQTRKVLAYKLLCANTIDEEMLKRLEEKQRQFDSFADESMAAKYEAEIDLVTQQEIIEKEIERIRRSRG